jgi:hypothetical protein
MDILLNLFTYIKDLVTNNVDIIICLIAIKTITATTNIKYKL